MRFVSLLLLTLLYHLTFSQSESDIQRIKMMTEEVHAHLNDYKKTILKTADPSDTDKNEIEIYTTDSKTIRLIKEIYHSETGMTIISDYLKDGEPYFVLKEYITYNLSVPDKKYDLQKATKKEVSYYFKNGRVIRWMTGKKTNKFDKASAIVENNIIENIHAIVSEFNKTITP